MNRNCYDGSMEISALHALYSTMALQPSDVIDAVLARIRSSNDDAIWISYVDEKQLRILGERLNHLQNTNANFLQEYPLFGIPFGVKDNIDVSGMITTAGFQKKDTRATNSAEVVNRLESAGAILIGKTNMDQFATGLVGIRSPFGIPRNPFNEKYIPGGSSSGSAVAVARKQISFSLGTDTAGSGRVPAGMNNLVGLKPTPGIFSTTGVFPACRSLDCVSIFAENIVDVAMVANTIVGFDPQDIFSRKEAKKIHWQNSTFSKFRFAIPNKKLLEFFGDSESEAAFSKAVNSMESCGGLAEEIDFAPFVETAKLLYEGPWITERRIAFGEWLQKYSHDVNPAVLEAVSDQKEFSSTETFNAVYKLQALRQKCFQLLEEIDCLLLPTVGKPFTIEEASNPKLMVNQKLGYYTNFVNLLGLCAVAVPSNVLPNRIPFGVTLIGLPFEDNKILNLACKLVSAQSKLEMSLKSLARKVVADDSLIPLCVVGGHMSGLPLNHQLLDRGAVFLDRVRTAPHYSLFQLNGFTPPRPGMVRMDNGTTIEGELWGLDASHFGEFVASIPPPLCIGNIALEDGRAVPGFLCEQYATVNAKDISSFKSWRSYLSSRSI